MDGTAPRERRPFRKDWIMTNQPRTRARTKADWLLEQHFPDEPTFPLDPELVARMPKGLTGRLPRNAEELYGLEASDSTKAPSEDKDGQAPSERPVRLLLPSGLPTAEQLSKLYERLTGRQTTPEELERSRQRLASIAAKRRL